MAYYSYLIKGHAGIYYFRIGIPKTYRPQFNNKSAVRKSLKTRSRKEATLLAQQYAKLYQDRFKTISSKAQINSSLTLNLPPIEPLKQIEKAPSEASTKLKLSDCISVYLANIKLRHKVKAEFIIKEKKPIYERLLEIVGDRDITEVTFLDASNFFEKIQQLPVNMRKIFTNNETIDEILKSKKNQKLKKLSPRTVNKYLENVTTLFKFYLQNGVIYRNVFDNKNLRAVENGRACDRRQRFSSEDLKAIFEDGKYFRSGNKDKFFKESYYWVTLVALYTGARVTEISQLHVNDILQVEDIWCISIAETSDLDINNIAYKSLKNKSSCRLIPIHDQLISLGFLNFVEKVRKRKTIRLFIDIAKRRKGVYGGIVGSWFNKNKKSYFNLDNPRQSFHSFRHTFIDTLKQAGIAEELVAIVVGHARKSITFNLYGKDYSVAFVKQQVIDRLDFGLRHR